MIPDVNLLVACALEGHAHHRCARTRMDDALNADAPEALELPMQVLAGFVRVVTHPRITTRPLSAQQALQFIDVLLSASHVRPIDDPATAWTELSRLCRTHDLRGAIVSDAWLAATVVQRRERLVTFDRDFVALLPPERLELLPLA